MTRALDEAVTIGTTAENGLTLCSTDTDFARFTDLRWETPLRN